MDQPYLAAGGGAMPRRDVKGCWLEPRDVIVDVASFITLTDCLNLKRHGNDSSPSPWSDVALQKGRVTPRSACALGDLSVKQGAVRNARA